MSWWTSHRKELLGLLGGGAAVASGVGAPVFGSMAGLLGISPETATGATAALVPGLSATGPTSQAAMLAAQNEGLGLGALAKTAQAGATAQGVNPVSAGLTGLLGGAKNAGMAMSGANLLTGGQRQPYQPPPPPQAQFQPAPVNAGYQSAQTGMPDPSDPDYLKKLLAMMQAQRGMQ